MRDREAPALEVRELSHAFADRQALRDVSFQVARGAFVALLGVNGAGKTTLINLITRLYGRRAGVIRICGFDPAAAPTAALGKLGVVFQTRSLDASLSVRRNLLYAGALFGLSAREAMTRAEPLLELVELGDRLGDRVETLSGGQQRKLEIVRALLHRPALLLCDEATAGLDIRARRQIVDLVHALAVEQGVGVLWATHLTDEIREGDGVVVLHEGKILAQGGAEDIAREAVRRRGGTLGAAPADGAYPLAEAFLTLTDRAGEPTA